MRVALGLAVAAVALGGARVARIAAEIPEEDAVSEPYTPSEVAAPFVSLGYREALADLLYVRLRGYYGGYYDTTASGVGGLGEAIVTLDPRFHRVYEFAANAMTIAPNGVDQATFHRAISLLERGMQQFPDDWNLPMLAGQMYTQDLQTTDPAQRRAWDERGVLLIESAIRKPGAPMDLALWAADKRSRLGQKQRAVDGLRELLLNTDSPRFRKHLLARLAKLEDTDSADVATEVLEMKKHFETAWTNERPFVTPSMYVLVGARLRPGFDMTELATGGHDLVGSQPAPAPVEPLE